MPQVVLLQNNRRLSHAEVARARVICDEALGWVRDREAYINQHSLDRRFALPDANWSYDAPNEFVQLFRRISQADSQTLAHFRGLTPVFTGYNLYEVCKAFGLRASTMELSANLDEQISARLEKQNHLFVRRWRKMTVGIPRRFLFKPPPLLGEVGHEINRVIVNSDTCTYQERINLIYASGLADWLDQKIKMGGDVRIVEIGGGYGALCHWFKQAYPAASYTIIDLPESLLFARLYISLTRPDLVTVAGLAEAPHGVRFVPNYMAEQLNERFDLVINTLSMSEMSEYQIKRYVDLMKRVWLTDDGVFFEQNHDHRACGLQCAEEVFKLEFPEHISVLSRRRPRNGSPNIWALSPIRLKPKRPSGVMTGLISKIRVRLRNFYPEPGC